MLTEDDKKKLIEIAKESIAYGLVHNLRLAVDIKHAPAALQKNRASFVTLNIGGQLRGCIGTLEAYRPLIEDVSENAYSAAFQDPRFNPVSESEYEQLEYHISILEPAEDFPVTSEEELLQQLRPGIDGLILEDGYHRATFLPSVWESLPTAKAFLHHLKLKAGLPENYWSDTIRFQRYEVEAFS